MKNKKVIDFLSFQVKKAVKEIEQQNKGWSEWNRRWSPQIKEKALGIIGGKK